MVAGRLFNIEPIGIGTPYVESLPSYIKRLAEAHSISPRTLLKYEILPEIREYLNTVLYSHNKYLLSISSNRIKDVIRVLEIKTNNKDIHNLSMSKLSGFINPRYLFRNNAAWCPLCYEKSKQYHEPVYEQLIWAISDIDTCGIHGIRLHEKCPHCHNQIKHYNTSSRVGYCYHCNHWLGSDKPDSNSYADFNEWDIWRIDNIGSILTDIRNINLSAKSCLSRNILEILNLTGFSRAQLGKEIGVSPSSIRDWAIFYKKPTLNSVLLLGYILQLPLSKLLFTDINSSSINITSFKEVPNPKTPKVGYSKLKRSIKKAISSTELVSVNRLMIKFGVKRTTIKRHFPREYNLLIQKNNKQKEEIALERESQIRDTMISLNERGVFPNRSKVMRELGKQFVFTERYRKVWRGTLRELGYTDKSGSV